MLLNKPVVKTLLGAMILCGVGAVAVAQGGARIASGDVLKITTFNELTLTGDFTVGPDGTVDFPYIGRVKAEGLTASGVRDAIRKSLIDGKYMLNPQITVEVQQATTGKHVNVFGEVRAPAAYAFGGNMRVLDLLARAGSTMDTADDIAQLCHGMSGESDAAAMVAPAKAPDTPPDTTADPADDPSAAAQSNCEDVDLHELMSGSTKANVELQDGDTLFVRKAQPVYVTGQVKAPSAYQVARGTTVLQIITLAGGPTPQGKMGGVTILRKVAGKKDLQKISVKNPKTETVQPGDTINVPKSFFGGGD